VETFIVSLGDVALWWLAISIQFIGKQEVNSEVYTTDGDSFLYEITMRPIWVGAQISNWYFPSQGSFKLCASDNNNNTNSLHLYSAFLDTQSALHREGNLLNHHQCAASTWMMRRLP